MEPAFQEMFSVRNADGDRVIVPVLEEDSLHDVMQRVARVGGQAVLLALGQSDEDGSLRLGIARLIMHERSNDDHDLPVGPRSTVGDLFRLMREGTSISLRPTQDEFEMLSEGPLPEGVEKQLIDA